MMQASYRSFLNQLSGAMFADSDLAKNFKMNKIEVSQIIVFGVAEYFYKSPMNLAKQSPFFLLLFGANLNQILNKEQMDLQIRFYDNISREATRRRYLDSCFTYRPNAVNLCNEMTNGTKSLYPTKMLMIGMDGVNVNRLIIVNINGE